MLVWDGNGIGPEIVPCAMQVVEAVTNRVNWVRMPEGLGEGGQGMQEKHLAAFDEAKVMMKGPLTIEKGKGLIAARGKNYTSGNQVFRKVFSLYANVRPVHSWKGVATPFQLDWVIFRENTEDIYTGEERVVQDGEAVEGIKRNSRTASRRIALRALEYAKQQGRDKITFIHKANVSKLGDGLFLEECWKVARDMGMADKCEDQLADSFLAAAVQKPSRFNVLVCPNLFGDLISDLAGGMVGSLGLCGSGNVGDAHALFEPAHGSAPDVAGRGVASPLSMVLSAALMLRHLGEREAAARVERAVGAVIEAGVLTPDLGGKCGTQEVLRGLLSAVKQ